MAPKIFASKKHTNLLSLNSTNCDSFLSFFWLCQIFSGIIEAFPSGACLSLVIIIRGLKCLPLTSTSGTPH
jgi:hypothetical protein